MTILETSVALMVLGIAILGILSGIYMASRISMSNRNYINATQILETTIEGIKDSEYADINDDGPFEIDSLPNGTSTVIVDAKGEGKEITVRVDWTELDRPLNLEFKTFVREE